MSIWIRCKGLPEVNDHSGALGFPWLTVGTCQTSIAVAMHLFGRARPPESIFYIHYTLHSSKVGASNAIMNFE